MAGTEKLSIKVSLKIQRTMHDVYEAIVDPAGMTNYFLAESSGRMESGKTLHWKFPEMDMQFPVKIKTLRPDDYISFYWDNMFDGSPMLVEIQLKQMADGTFVTITEKEMDNTGDGIKWLRGNTEGWANFLACLKAWLEYGINLRKGAFDISQMPEENK